MKRVLNFLLVLIGLSVVAVGALYFIYPGVILGAVTSMSVNNAGLEHRKVDIDGYSAHYYEGGSSNQTTLVLLHPFTEDKSSFVTSIRTLSQHYRVILPDLQGHGDNAQTLNLAYNMKRYSIKGQAHFINRLLLKLNANRVFIGGNEMGGHVALSYAANFSEQTLGLVLINSAGLNLGINNESTYEPLPISVSNSYFVDKFARLYVTPPSYPKPVLQYLSNQLNPSINFFNSVLKQVEAGEDARLNQKALSIKAPALILWGQQDPVLGRSYAELIEQSLSNATLKELANAGSSPQFEVPELVGNEIKAFLDSAK